MCTVTLMSETTSLEPFNLQLFVDLEVVRFPDLATLHPKGILIIVFITIYLS